MALSVEGTRTDENDLMQFIAFKELKTFKCRYAGALSDEIPQSVAATSPTANQYFSFSHCCLNFSFVTQKYLQEIFLQRGLYRPP